jgi:chaperone modulatory protein CbpM
MAIGAKRRAAREHGGVSMRTREFLMQARLDAEALDAWIEAGWLRPEGRATAREFSDIDMARAQLIRDLRQDLGINDEAIPIILDLIDQVHGLRRLLRGFVARARA